MDILVLNGSPRPNGATKNMVNSFEKGAKDAGHNVTVFDVCSMNIHGCLACEYCHTKGDGKCIQQDDMQKIYPYIENAEMLVIASPIYYHNLSGQVKCALDRFYAPDKPKNLKKIAYILSSGSPNMYIGAEFSYNGDFVDYLGCEPMGIFTSYGSQNNSEEKMQELYNFGKNIK